MRLFLVSCIALTSRCLLPWRSPPPPTATTGARLGRDPHRRDPQRHRRPQRHGHELALRVRHDDRLRAQLRRRRRRRRATTPSRPRWPCRVSARARPTTTGSSPTNADGTVTGADRTFRTAAGPALPGISSTVAREVGPTERVAAQPHRPQPRRDELPLRVRPLDSPTARARPSARSGAGDSRVVRRRDDRRPAAVPPLPLPRRGDQRGRAQRRAATGRSRRSRQPTAISLQLAAPRTPWGEGIEVFGKVTGRGRERHPGRARAPGLPVRRAVLGSIGRARADRAPAATAASASSSRRCSPPRACARSRARRSWRPARP